MTSWPLAPLHPCTLLLSLGTGLALLGCGGGGGDGVLVRGTVEVPELDLAPMVAARVVAIRVDEGDSVAAGDTVAILRQSELPASVAAQEARVRAAEAGLRELEAGSRPQEIARADADVASARSEAERTAKELERIRPLAEAGVVSRQMLDNARAAATAAAERVKAAEAAVALLRAGTRLERIRAARADLGTARASLDALEARAADLVLVSPVDGRILQRLAEPGEVLGPGIPAVTVGDLGRWYVRVYLPASRIATLSLGDSATVTVSGVDLPPVQGVVGAINPEAEFTPRVALTERERADLMFGVKVMPAVGARAVHPGLWATVRLAPGAAR